MRKRKHIPNVIRLRPETLIQMLHRQWVFGFVTSVLEEDMMENGDDSPIPMDKGGPETVRWIHEMEDDLLNLRVRKDGTHYMPESKTAPASLPLPRAE